MNILFIFLTTLTIIIPVDTKAQIGGKAKIIDGDTIQIGDNRIRLYGIDAPELKQVCKINGRNWMCGEEAAMALAYEMANHWISCITKGKDRYARTLAICFKANIDINREMVKRGLALAYRKYSNIYIEYEELAKSNKLGIWKSNFIKPWNWRMMRKSLKNK